WDAATGKELLALAGHHAEVRAAAFSPDGSTLVTLSPSPDGSPPGRLWDARSGRRRAVLTQPSLGLPSAVRGRNLARVVFSPDGKYLLTVNQHRDQGQEQDVWDTATGKHRYSLSRGPSSEQIHAGVFSPDGRCLVGGEAGKEAWLR